MAEKLRACRQKSSNGQIGQMSNFQELFIAPDGTVADAVQMLERNSQKICLVTDSGKLIGTVTDGDIRRGLLRGVTINASVTEVMNANPRVAAEESDRDQLRALMTEQGLLHMPVIDKNSTLTGVITLNELVGKDSKFDNWIVLMAGGLGERLRPLTETTPKPLLQIGDKPLLQSILESFTEQGFCNFFISVNYHADAIKRYFGNGEAWGVNIRYLEEESRMGTAGALALLPETPTAPLIVMNGDLVTRTSFKDLLDFHVEQKSTATMCVREYDFQVPFGVVAIDEHRITSIDEKPVHRFFVNAGIYVLDPKVVTGISKGARTDMTQVFDGVIADGGETAAFPIHEYWLDIGRIDDLERAQSDFVKGRNK